MQQSLVASIKTKQYTEALSKADQSQNLVVSRLAVTRLGAFQYFYVKLDLLAVLTTDPHSSLIQDLRRTLAEKVDLGNFSLQPVML